MLPGIKLCFAAYQLIYNICDNTCENTPNLEFKLSHIRGEILVAPPLFGGHRKQGSVGIIIIILKKVSLENCVKKIILSGIKL